VVLRWVRELLLPVGLMIGSAAAIQAVRPGLFETVTKIKDDSDTYVLPPPEQLPALTLGYRSAGADLIWAYMMVTQGLRIQQRRRFEFAERYFESIFELEPTYRHPYLLLDTLLTFGIKPARPIDAENARRLFERGLRERPNDAQLHLQAGSFMAYLAPSILPEEQHKEWRLAGARLMSRAGELGAADTNLQWHSLASARALNRAGERAAAIAFLERIFEITEDAELRQEILRQLRGLQAEDAAERARGAAERFEKTWRDDLPFVSRSMVLLLGPSVSAAPCAGVGRGGLIDCARDWKTWAARGKL